MLIGLVGQRNSGKSTFAKYCVTEQGFIELAFATAVKKITNIVYGFPLELLAGDTPESRAQRSVAREPYSNKTAIECMQFIGTELFRNNVGEDIWIHIVKQEIERLRKENSNVKIIVSDCRFPNEMSFIRKMGGQIILLDAEEVNTDKHASENSFQSAIDLHHDIICKNDKSRGLDEFHRRIRNVIKSPV